MTRPAKPVVAIVGAGYAGMTAAGRLKGKAHVILVNPVDVFVDRIRLHEYIAGTRTYWDTATPIREHLAPDAELLIDSATAVESGHVALASGRQLRADHVIVGIGSGGAGGVATLTGAEDVRGQLTRCAPGDHVLVRGAGHTGTEVASEIAVARPDLHITLCDPRGVLPDMSPQARGTAMNVLGQHGVRTVMAPLPTTRYRVTIDCTGFAVPVLRGLATPNRNLMISDGLWVAGDAAQNGTRMSCAAAEPMGAHVADNILRVARGLPPQTFDFGFVNQALSLGRHHGIVQPTRRDGSPRGTPLTGRAAALAKEAISRMARRVALRSAKLYRWPGGT